MHNPLRQGQENLAHRTRHPRVRRRQPRNRRSAAACGGCPSRWRPRRPSRGEPDTASQSVAAVCVRTLEAARVASRVLIPIAATDLPTSSQASPACAPPLPWPTCALSMRRCLCGGPAAPGSGTSSLPESVGTSAMMAPARVGPTDNGNTRRHAKAPSPSASQHERGEAYTHKS